MVRTSFSSGSSRSLVQSLLVEQALRVLKGQVETARFLGAQAQNWHNVLSTLLLAKASHRPARRGGEMDSAS